MPMRRKFLGRIAAVPMFGSMGLSSLSGGSKSRVAEPSREKIRALLVSATTMAGKSSLEHAEEELKKVYSGKRQILLINFASQPVDRDTYAARMQRDFSRIDERFEVDSLHAYPIEKAGRALRQAEAVFVSGGNTFLLLRELYDRNVVELLRDRVFGGMPYAGSSAGSNLAGVDIGTTNDFPLIDVPTRRSLGILPGTFNPHHPEIADTAAYGSRQYKISDHARFHPLKPVVGVNNAGMISIRGNELSLRGKGGFATIQVGSKSTRVEDHTDGNVSRAINQLLKQTTSNPS